MANKKSVISYTRTCPEEIEMVDGRGVKIYIHPKATLPQMVAAGVRHITMHPIENPPPPIPHHYVDNSEPQYKTVATASQGVP